MIKPHHLEAVVEARNLLSPDYGLYTESMAPVLGYPVRYHGSIMPLGTNETPTRTVKSTSADGTVFMNVVEIYKERKVVIDEDGQTITVLASPDLNEVEVDGLLECWSTEFVKKWIPGWVPNRDDEL
jgi:hypothetical protein